MFEINPVLKHLIKILAVDAKLILMIMHLQTKKAYAEMHVCKENPIEVEAGSRFKLRRSWMEQ
jgi:hypothetical protein